MDFQETTDRLMELGVGLRDLADALGVSYQSARMFRLDPEASGYRSPPENWREAVVELARERGGELLELAEKLDEDAGRQGSGT